MFGDRFIYTKHSIQRRTERCISAHEIVKTVNDPDYVISSPDDRKIASKIIGERKINVVYKEGKNIIIVITVY